MPTISASDASKNFSATLDTAQREPVWIQRHGRNVAVVLSAAEYEWLHKDRWSEFNRLSALAAEQAKANGLTEDLLAAILAE